MDRPIIFSGPMVEALLAGRKTQTRRILKPQPNMLNGGKPLNNGRGSYSVEGGWKRYPIAVGNRLWVRETWAHYQTVNHTRQAHGGAFSEVSDGLAGYRADGHDTIEDFRDHVRLMSGCDLEAVEINGDKWRPSIFMPRWASRLTLTVTDVRVQRLQDISEEDAVAEGYPSPEQRAQGGVAEIRDAYPIAWYSWLWDSINGAGSWEANPWVSAISFTAEHRNIDAPTPSDRREGL